jgi:hypothetical protein
MGLDKLGAFSYSDIAVFTKAYGAFPIRRIASPVKNLLPLMPNLSGVPAHKVYWSVMPALIRHPETFENTGFRLSPE